MEALGRVGRLDRDEERPLSRNISHKEKAKGKSREGSKIVLSELENN